MRLKFIKIISESEMFRKNKIKFLVIALSGIIVMAVMQSCSCGNLYSKGDIRQEKIENSEQYDDGKFANKEEVNPVSAGTFFSTMWEWMFGGGTRTPELDIESVPLDIESFNTKDDNQLKVSWMGHSSVIINLDGKLILTDPVYSEKVSFVGPSRFNDNLPVKISDLPEIDLVVISHNHMDHLDFDTIKEIKDRVKKFAVPLGVSAYLEDCDVDMNKVIELDWWEEAIVDDKIKVAATPAQHFSGRSLTDSDKSLWASWVIQGSNHKVYFSGDSGYFEGFKEIGEKYGPFDITLIECGQYNERWGGIHMFPEQSVQAHIDVKGKLMLPIHWGAFKLAMHDWFDPVKRAVAASNEKGTKITTPQIGEVVDLAKEIPVKHWWKNYIKEEK